MTDRGFPREQPEEEQVAVQLDAKQLREVDTAILVALGIEAGGSAV